MRFPGRVALAGCLAIGVAAVAAAGPGKPSAVRFILDRLSRNVEQVGTLSFRASHVIVYESRPSGTVYTFGILQQVDYDRSHDRIRVEYLSPDQRVEEFEDQETRPISKVAFTGMSLWVLDPYLQVSSYAV